MHTIIFIVGLFVTGLSPASSSGDGDAKDVLPLSDLEIVEAITNYVENLTSLEEPLVANLGVVSFQLGSSKVTGRFDEQRFYGTRNIVVNNITSSSGNNFKFDFNLPNVRHESEQNPLNITHGDVIESKTVDLRIDMELNVTGVVFYGHNAPVRVLHMDVSLTPINGSATVYSQDSTLIIAVDSLVDETNILKQIYEAEISDVLAGEMQGVFSNALP